MIIIIKQMNEWINIFSYLFITLKYHQYNYKIISLQHKNNGTLLNKYITIIYDIEIIVIAMNNAIIFLKSFTKIKMILIMIMIIKIEGKRILDTYLIYIAWY